MLSVELTSAKAAAITRTRMTPETGAKLCGEYPMAGSGIEGVGNDCVGNCAGANIAVGRIGWAVAVADRLGMVKTRKSKATSTFLSANRMRILIVNRNLRSRVLWDFIKCLETRNSERSIPSNNLN
jgi:hypothetical protein